MAFDNALERAMGEGFGALFVGGAIDGLIQVASGNAASVTASSIIANPLVLLFMVAAMGYGFFSGRKKDRLEEKVEALQLAQDKAAAGVK